MKTDKRAKKQLTAWALALAVFWSEAAAVSANGAGDEALGSGSGSPETELFVVEETYNQYCSKYEEVGGLAPIEVDVTDIYESDKTSIVEKEYGYDGKCVVTEEGGFAAYRVSVPKSGFYAIRCEYYPLEGLGINIEKEVWINGERPYFEAGDLTLTRVFRDSGSVRDNVDSNGNEMRPRQEEVSGWFEDGLRDGGNYYSEPMKFWLEAGEQEIRIFSQREAAAVRRMVLEPEERVPSYGESLPGDASTAGGGLVCYLEAEMPARKSSAMLIPGFDRASPATSPVSMDTIKLNIISGERYKIPGQWLEYEFEVPEDGLYKIGLRARQNISSGTYSSRNILIDGEVPFEEARNIHFNYSNSWQIVTPEYEGEACLFWLTKGKHTLRIEATLGDIAKYLDIVQECLSELNEAYRQILMITGPSPDLYRDYYFEQEIPEVFECFREQQKILEEVYSNLLEEVGLSGEKMGVFGKMQLFFDIVLEEPEKLVKQMSNLKSYIGALATWTLDVREQPLDLDGIYVGEAQYAFPEAEAGFFGKVKHEIGMFVSSFFSDFNSVKSEMQDSRGTVTVWTSASRDQVNILRQMIDEDFSKTSGIDINLQLVTAGSLLPSALAGIGPDVALGVSSADVMNYAARGAILDLSGFEGIEEVKSRFMDSALLPMEYENGFYGIPETQTFPVLFYRKDILAQLGLEVPRTWKDVYLMLTELQKKNMTFGLRTGMPSYSMFLYQQGGSLYRDGNRFSNLSSDISVSALRTQTDMFLAYQLPQKYDFSNRFRTGEIPVAVEDYTSYNQLSVFAPEIRGLWGFTTVPGTEDEEGAIDSSVISTVNACVIMSKAEHPDLAYEFISWLTSTDTQVRYGRELETILGTAARYNSANVDAVRGSAWQRDEIDALLAQWEEVQGIPEVPGGYYTTRYVDFAFRSVVLQGQLPREVMMENEEIVNEEINYKRIELGLE